MRYRIEVRCRRGEHHYSYVEHERVKAGKAQRVVDTTAVSIAAHEGRDNVMPRFDWHLGSDEDVHPVTVTFSVFDCEFHVSAVPLQGG